MTEDIQEIANLLGEKYAALRELEDEVAHLKRVLHSRLEFSQDEIRKVSTPHVNFKLKEQFRLSIPNNYNMAKKAEFYRFMQEKYRNWYRENIFLNWRACSLLANAEWKIETDKGNEWKPWPHCTLGEETELEARLKVGAKQEFADPKVFTYKA